MKPAQKIRVSLLLLVLAVVVFDSYMSRNRTTDWQETLWVGVYPVNADGSATTSRYIQSLKDDDFRDIEEYFLAEAGRYGIATTGKPIDMRLGAELHELPPLPPPENSMLGNMWWSLKLRFWANDNQELPGGLVPDIRVYLLFFDPETSPRLRHSLGLQKGLVGIVNLFASDKMRKTNNFVIGHEILHTLGASDKYDPVTGLPIFPHGYAEPEAEPLYPQSRAEVMGGRLPINAREAEIPRSLKQTLVGPLSAFEINWIQQDPFENPPAP